VCLAGGASGCGGFGGAYTQEATSFVAPQVSPPSSHPFSTSAAVPLPSSASSSFDELPCRANVRPFGVRGLGKGGETVGEWRD